MRKLVLGLHLFAATIGAWAIVASQDPGIQGPATAFVRLQNWVQTGLGRGGQGPNLDVATATPTFTRPLPPTPTLAPVAPAAPAFAGWGYDSCAWAKATMQTDASDDIQSETMFPAYVSYYVNAATHWTQTLAYIAAGPCASPAVQLTGSQCSDPQSWFQVAYQSHVTDTATRPDQASWDNQWEAAYTRMESLWTAACA